VAHILLIDDEALVREGLGLTLTEAGHTVDFAENGDEGMRKLLARRPDLVITDIVMPDHEGIETIINMRRENPSLGIIAISGGNADFLRAASALGATKVLRKPFGAAALLQIVAECLEPGSA
jgi:YesN/AraC family two-component response regulator